MARCRLAAIAVFVLLFSAGIRCLAEGAAPDAPQLRVELGMHSASIFDIDVDAADRYLITGSVDQTVRVWDAASGEAISVLRVPNDGTNRLPLCSIAISPDGNTIACGCSNELGTEGWIYLADRATDKITSRMPGVNARPNDMRYSKDGHYLAVAGRSGGVRIYDALNGYAQTGGDDGEARAAIRVDIHETRLAATYANGSIRLYDIQPDGSLKLARKVTAPDGAHPDGVSFSPSGKKLAICYEDVPVVSVLSVPSLARLPGPDCSGLTGAGIFHVCWSANGSSLFAGGGRIKGPDGTATFPILRWPEQGRGARVQVATAGNSITGLKARDTGGMYYGAADPSFGVIERGGKQVIFQSSPIVAFRTNSVLVSSNASTVRFESDSGKIASACFSVTDGGFEKDDKTGLDAPNSQEYSQFFKVVQSPDGPLTVNGVRVHLNRLEKVTKFVLAPDHQSLLLGGNGHIVDIGSDGKQVWTLPIREPVESLSIAANGKVCVAAFLDGTIHWYRASDGVELLALFPHPDGKRWVTWTPSGYYDCAPGAEDLIGWVVNTAVDQAADFYPASRFRATYYRPDVVRRVLDTLDETEALKQADAERGQTTQPVDILTALPPVVSIVSPASGDSVSTTDVAVAYDVKTPDSDPVTGVTFLIDGRPVSPTRDLKIVDSGTPHRTQHLTIPAADCAVTVIARNSHGNGPATTVKLHWTGDKPAEFVAKPTLYVLAIGVSHYKNLAPEEQLTYPAKDATDFANAVQTQKGLLYQDVVVKLLTNDGATRDTIDDGLEWLEHQTTQHDVSMVFLSGHGIVDSDGNYFYVPSDFSKDHIRSTGLAFSDIKQTIQNLAGKTLFFVDTCHSGDAIGTKTRGLDLTGVVNELSSAENGAVVFAASTGRQSALEDPAWGNGAFTKALLEALGGAADYNHDGRITVNMLDVYISDRVKKLTDGSQTPTTTKPETVPDFPVAIVKE